MSDEPTETFLEAVAAAREEIERVREIRKLVGQLAAETCCTHDYRALHYPDAEQEYCIGCGKRLS